MQLISAYVDGSLRLTEAEETVFQRAVDAIEPQERGGVMELTTSWMKQSIVKGLGQG